MCHLRFTSCLLVLLLGFAPLPCRAGLLDDLTGSLNLPGSKGTGLDDPTIVKGLKEALSTGTKRAVGAVSKTDGYFGNEMIRIPVPEKLRTVADLLARIGFQQEVDDFILSMNRAAEKAAPRAGDHFVSALKAMTFDDARKILQGGDTSATDYFRQKTSDRIYADFKPVVTEKMQEVGVTRSYGQMMKKFEAIPFAGAAAPFDLEHYVTGRAVNGLFTMLGQEEKKIRTDPAARGTELLRKVFGK